MIRQRSNSLECDRALEFHVYGRVQGVGFRYSAITRARALGLRGFVRNVSDGSVEGYAEGVPGSIAAFTAWLRHGPPGADVDNLVTRSVDVKRSGISGRSERDYKDFTLLW